MLIGTVISIVGLLILAAMMHYVYHMPHELNWYVWGFLACLPGYWFGPFVFYLFKGKREKKVITANLVGIFVSVGVLLLTISSYGISGAIAATAIAQIAMLAYYYLIFKSKLKPINSNLQTK